MEIHCCQISKRGLGRENGDILNKHIRGKKGQLIISGKPTVFAWIQINLDISYVQLTIRLFVRITKISS